MKIQYVEGKQPKERILIGKLWQKTGKKGEFMTGPIGAQKDGKEMFQKIELQPKDRLMIFKNDKGDNEKRPDWLIYLAK